MWSFQLLYRIFPCIIGLSCLSIHLARCSTHISVYLSVHLSIRQSLCLSFHLYIRVSLSLFGSSSSRVYGPVSCYAYFCDYCRSCFSDCQITFWLVRLSVLIQFTGYSRTMFTIRSVVGIETHCGREGPGIVSRWQRVLPYPSKTSWGPSSLQYNGYSAFSGVKAARTLRLPPFLRRN